MHGGGTWGAGQCSRRLLCTHTQKEAESSPGNQACRHGLSPRVARVCCEGGRAGPEAEGEDGAPHLEPVLASERQHIDAEPPPLRQGRGRSKGRVCVYVGVMLVVVVCVRVWVLGGAEARRAKRVGGSSACGTDRRKAACLAGVAWEGCWVQAALSMPRAPSPEEPQQCRPPRPQRELCSPECCSQTRAAARWAAPRPGHLPCAGGSCGSGTRLPPMLHPQQLHAKVGRGHRTAGRQEGQQAVAAAAAAPGRRQRSPTCRARLEPARRSASPPCTGMAASKRRPGTAPRCASRLCAPFTGGAGLGEAG